MYIIKRFLTIIIAIYLPLLCHAEDISREQIKGLDEQVQDIKKDVLAISSELSLLEEKLLFPSNTQISLFVSVVKDSKYVPDAIQINLDNKEIAYHIYSFKEVGALTRGGVQRIYTGNIKSGEHTLDIKVIGKLGKADNETSSASFKINKEINTRLVEIRLGNENPPISLKDQ